MSLRPVQLGHKLGAVLLVLMVGVALVTGGLVYFAFQRTQDNATARSQEGLEDLGRRLTMEMAQSQADLTVVQLEQSARIALDLAAYFTEFKRQGGNVPWDNASIVTGPQGQRYDASPDRLSDVFVPNFVEMNHAVIGDIVDSAALDAMFPGMMASYPGMATDGNFKAVAIFYQSSNQVARYYPAIGLENIIPADARLEFTLNRVGPVQNPDRLIYWNEPYEDDAGHGLMITASAPIYEGDVYRGRIGVDFTMARLVEKLNQTKPTQGGFAFYVDRSGELLPTDSFDVLTRGLAAGDGGVLADVLEAMGRNESSVERVMLEGEPYFVAYASMEPVGGSFGVAAPVTEIAAQAAVITAAINEEGNRTVAVLFAVIAAIFAAGLFVATWLNRRLLLQPIEALVAGTRAVADGNLDVAIPARGEDEMAALARSFNRMTSDLRSQRDALREEARVRQAAQDELRALFTAMTDVVMIVDSRTGSLRVPSIGAPGALPAADPEHLTGRTLFEVLPHDVAELFLQRIRAALILQDTQTFEYPLEIGGVETWFSAAASPLSTDAAVVVSRDITEIKRTEQALRSAQERHLALLNSVDAVLWEGPADFSCFTFVSEQAERLLGYPLQRWLEEPGFWASHIHPDDRDWCVSYCVEQTESRRDHDFQYRMIAADGRTVWLRDIVTVVTEDDRPVALRGVMIDITALKLAMAELADREEQYRAVFEASSDGLVITDPETDLILAANPAFCQLHGWEDMTGFQPDRYVHPESRHIFEEDVAAVRAGSEFRHRAQNVRRNGSVIDVEVYARHFMFQGRVARLAVVRDVTEQVRAFQLLEERVAERTHEIERRRVVAEGLRDLLAIVNSGRSLDEMLDAVVAQASRLLDSDASTILLPAPEDPSTLTTRAATRVEERLREARLPVNLSAAGLAYRMRRPAVVPDAAHIFDPSSLQDGADPSVPSFEDQGEWLRVFYLPAPLDEQQRIQSRSFGNTYRGFLAVPLASRDQVYGTLTLDYREPREFTDEEVALALAFADQAALALENARLSEQAQQAAALEERQRLARDLHDAVTQTLFSTSLIAEVVPDLWKTKPDLARQRLDDLRRLTRGALAEMRTLLVELRPGALTELPLRDLLRQLAEATAGRTNLKVSLDVEGQPEGALPGEVQIALYRIAQESLNNIVRHAQASEAKLLLCYEPSGGVEMRIRDDGRGFDPEAIPGGHLGVGIMRERASAIGATIEVDSRPGEGTGIHVLWGGPDHESD